jgi:AcrR family transcriptional regulator
VSTAGDTRARILDAAVRRIAREGIDDVRIARIATDAGVSPALVHYHFASREALLVEALEHSYELAGSSRAAAAADGPAVERLAAMIEGCLPLPGDQRDDWVLWVELWLRAARRPELAPTAGRLYSRLHEWFEAVLAEGLAAGEFAAGVDTDCLTDRLLAAIDGYGLRALIGDPAMPVERARAEVWAIAAEALGLPQRGHRATA